MSRPKSEEQTARLHTFMDDVRTETAKGDPHADPVDRVLAAVSMIAAATYILWPQGRRVTSVASLVTGIARQLWRHKAAWLP